MSLKVVARQKVKDMSDIIKTILFGLYLGGVIGMGLGLLTYCPLW